MSDQYYTFITPQRLMPREAQLAMGQDEAISCIDWLVNQSPSIVHYDLETTGLDFSDPKRIITNIGLATSDWLVGIDLVDVPFEKQEELWTWLSQQNLGGFNLGFDLAWPWRDEHGRSDLKKIKAVTDTALWFRLLATEGHSLQSHSLESLISTVLCWPQEYQQKGWLKSALEQHGLKKDQMWKLAMLEPHAYTRYCALDAEASFQAHAVFQSTLEEWGFQGLGEYHDVILMPKIKRDIKAAGYGIPIDREKLLRNIEWVNRRLVTLEAKALEHPDMKPVMEAWTERELQKRHKLKFNLKKEWALEKDEPWKYPDVYRIHLVKDPSRLAMWQQEFGGKFYKPTTQFTVSNNTTEWPRFNVSSTAEMKWLIYEHWLGGNYDVWYRDENHKKMGGLLKIVRNGRLYEIALTKGGGLPTGGDVLTLFGEIGSILDEYKTLKKLLGDFLEKYEIGSRRDGSVHASSKVLGTISGRMAGSGGNT